MSSNRHNLSFENIEESLTCELRKYKKIIIAFSGGADSTFLATFALKTLGKENVAVVHTKLPFSPPNELQLAQCWANDNDLKLYILDVDILNNESVKENGIDRCYFCKKEIMSRIIEEQKSNPNLKHFANIADGTLIDDLSDYRPGLKATDELAILHPLADVGIDKRISRVLARRMGLKSWKMAASACLATRVPYNSELSIELINRIGKIESFIYELGILGGRVRLIDTESIKIEVPTLYFRKIIKHRKAILKISLKIGFNNINLDLFGYRKTPPPF